MKFPDFSIVTYLARMFDSTAKCLKARRQKDVKVFDCGTPVYEYDEKKNWSLNRFTLRDPTSVL